MMLILKMIEEHGQFSGLEGKASIMLLKKVYLSLLNRWQGLKPNKNSFTLSFAEAWAFTYQVDRVDIHLGEYERNVWLNLRSGINLKVIN